MLKLLQYLKPYRFLAALTLLLVFLQAFADLYLPTLMADIVNVGIVTGNTRFIWGTGARMILVAFLGGACAVGSSYLSARVSSAFGRDLRRAVFERVSSFSLREFGKFGTASLITRTTNDVTQIQMVTLMALRLMAFAPMMAVGSAIMAVSKDPELSLVLLVVLPILGALIYAISRYAVPLFKSLQVKIDKMNLVLRERLTGVRVIRAFNREKHEEERFTTANEDLTQTAIRVNQLMALMMPGLMLLMNLTSIAVVWFGGLRIDRGQMQVGDLMAFIQYAMHILFSMVMLSMMFVLIPRASASATRMVEVLETEPTVVDPPQATLPPAGVRSRVEFRNVTFRYPGAERPALENVSFESGPGEVTAIIGGTGSGKTTLLSLIPRFFDVESGAVLVDGVDVREYSQESLRAKIGLVPQQPILFTGSVAENIRYGRDDAPDDEVKRAAEIAQASDFVSAMREGYDTAISQGGTNVSGGQKQRLAIARALVRRPEIYLFDDAFSALDFKTDARLRAALRQETGDATVLIVAQRVSTVMDADRIIVLDEGRVAGIGRHKELLESCPVYREIAASQLSEEEMAV